MSHGYFAFVVIEIDISDNNMTPRIDVKESNSAPMGLCCFGRESISN